jgi:hypothetical protein
MMKRAESATLTMGVGERIRSALAVGACADRLA